MNETCYRFSIYMSSEKVYMLGDGEQRRYDFETLLISERISYEPSEVISDFMRMYCNGVKPKAFENRIETPCMLLAKDSDGDFITPSDGMLEAYKKGQMQLYEVCYEMYVERVIDLNEDELKAMLNKEVA